MSDNIEVITLTRGTADEDGNWVSGGGHRVHANWRDAECEVKARVLRSLAARSNPPDGVAFVRGWDAPVQNVDTSAQVQTFGIAIEAAASCALDGDTQVLPQNYGPAAEMAAAARDAQAFRPEAFDLERASSLDSAAAAPKGRKRGR